MAGKVVIYDLNKDKFLEDKSIEPVNFTNNITISEFKHMKILENGDLLTNDNYGELKLWSFLEPKFL